MHFLSKVTWIMAVGKAKQQFDQGLAHFHRGEYGKALSYFEEVIYEEADNSEALYNLACCYSMTGNGDNAVFYLARAVNLNPHCQDWAIEDHEFDQVRDNPTFQKIVSGEDVFLEEEIAPTEYQMENSSEVENPDEGYPEPEENETDEFQEMEFEHISTQEQLDQPEAEFEDEPMQPEINDPPPIDPPPLDDGSKTTTFKQPEESGLPPCLRCDGIVREERRSIYSPMASLLTIYVGVISSIFLFLSIFGLMGIPVICTGLYMLSRVKTIWVCQNCGAMGKDAGQPSRQAEKSFQPTT